MFHLAKLRFTELEDLVRSKRTLVILPVGAVEEHGAHLPLGLDTLAAEAYAESAAPALGKKGFAVILAPPLSYGVARQALDFSGTLTIEPETLTATVVDIGRSLARHGIKRLVILNGHRDLQHMKALEEAASRLAGEGTVQALCVGFTSDPNITAACYREGVRELSQSPRPDREGHGGEWETSLALFRFPDLVDAKIIPRLEANFEYDADAFRAETKDYRQLTGGRGYFGSPGSGSAETGRKLVEIRGRNIARVILKAFEPLAAEYRHASAEDIAAILKIQSANHIDNLSVEQRRQGFLSAMFTPEQLAELAADLGITVVADGGCLLGFLCAFRRDFKHGSPVIAKMLETFDGTQLDGKPLSAYNAYIYGPVCVDPPYRGRGLLKGLYDAQKNEIAGKFDAGVAFVSRDNPHSLRAHVVGLGMTEVGEFEVNGKIYATLAFKVPTGGNP
jgi:creatinine amidohydrolase/Fe(II)-dependent formamide hydrolase-like protein